MQLFTQLLTLSLSALQLAAATPTPLDTGFSKPPSYCSEGYDQKIAGQEWEVFCNASTNGLPTYAQYENLKTHEKCMGLCYKTAKATGSSLYVIWWYPQAENPGNDNCYCYYNNGVQQVYTATDNFIAYLR